MGGRTSPATAPGLDALVHPMPLAALALLLVNDHVLKVSQHGFVSGKLSDVAVLILLPFVFLASWEVARMAIPRLGPVGSKLVVGSVALTMAIYVAIEIVPLAADLYRVGLGAAQLPFRALVALALSEPIPALAPVALTSDPSDLLVTPVAFIVLVVGPWRWPSLRRPIATLAGVPARNR